MYCKKYVIIYIQDKKRRKEKMKVTFIAELKNGYKKTMETEETKEVEITIEAKNMVTATRAFKALVDMNNVVEYWSSVID